MGEVATWAGGLEARCAHCSSEDVELVTEQGSPMVGFVVVGSCHSCGREFHLQKGPDATTEAPVVEHRHVE